MAKAIILLALVALCSVMISTADARSYGHHHHGHHGYHHHYHGHHHGHHHGHRYGRDVTDEVSEESEEKDLPETKEDSKNEPEVKNEEHVLIDRVLIAPPKTEKEQQLQ